MKVTMEFRREIAEKLVAVAKGALLSKTKAMTDEELLREVFKLISIYGFSDMEIVK